MHGSTAITIRRPVEEVYAYWRAFERLPSFMYHLQSVTTDGNRRSHWVAKAPAGTKVEWDAEVTEDTPNARIAWRSTEGADVSNRGSVRFDPAPAGQGTEVHVAIEFDPPLGALGTAVAKLFGEDPNNQIQDDLRRFKQILETGEVVRSEGSPEGATTGRQLHQRDAQPLEGSTT